MTTSWCDISRKSIPVAHCEQDIVSLRGLAITCRRTTDGLQLRGRTQDPYGALKGRAAGSVPEAGREIAFSKIVEQGHDTSRSLTTGDTFNAHHVGTGRLADKKARAG